MYSDTPRKASVPDLLSIDFTQETPEGTFSISGTVTSFITPAS